MTQRVQGGTAGLITAILLDGQGGGRELDWNAVKQWRPEDGYLWVHLNRSSPHAGEWLKAEISEPEILRTLLADETRPRAVPQGDQLLVTLRGVNLNPGEDPEDMINLRLWCGPHRVISTLRRHVIAATEMRESLMLGHGPRDGGDFLGRIADMLVQHMGPTLDGLNEVMDSIEERVLVDPSGMTSLQKEESATRRKLVRARQKVIVLRRYLAPQRDTLSRLQFEQLSWLAPQHRIFLREAADHTTRHVEDLEALRERGTVIQDELRNQLSETMNRTMYVLTLVAAILLPLTFVTGLLGINVDGIPGAEEAPWAFLAVCLGLLAVGGLQFLLFRRLRWL